MQKRIYVCNSCQNVDFEEHDKYEDLCPYCDKDDWTEYVRAQMEFIDDETKPIKKIK